MKRFHQNDLVWLKQQINVSWKANYFNIIFLQIQYLKKNEFVNHIFQEARFERPPRAFVFNNLKLPLFNLSVKITLTYLSWFFFIIIIQRQRRRLGVLRSWMWKYFGSNKQTTSRIAKRKTCSWICICSSCRIQKTQSGK